MKKLVAVILLFSFPTFANDLVVEGIQKGHMRLHARNLAAAAGATPEQIDLIVEKMVQANSISLDKAKELLHQI